jgi:hypothetical protein
MRDDKADRLNHFSKLLAGNFLKLKQTIDLLSAGKINDVLELDTKRRNELAVLDQEKQSIKSLFGKKKQPKQRPLHCLHSSDQIKKFNNQAATLKERYLNSVRFSLRRTVSSMREVKNPKFKLLELYFYFKKIEGENLIILFPTFDEITANDYQLNGEEQSQFRPDEHSGKFLYAGEYLSSVMSFVHFDSCIAINLHFKIQKTQDIRERLKNLDLEISIEDFNFHYIFETTRNFKAREIFTRFQTEYNSKKTLERFEGMLENVKRISLQLPASDFEFYNQLTKGFKVKSEELSSLKDNKLYIIKFFESMKEFLEISNQKSNLFCGYCHKYVISVKDDVEKQSYPVFYSKKKFHHDECFVQLGNS